MVSQAMALAPQVSAVEDDPAHSCGTRFKYEFQRRQTFTEGSTKPGAKPLALNVRLSARGFKFDIHRLILERQT
jgi:hypothetical protein